MKPMRVWVATMVLACAASAAVLAQPRPLKNAADVLAALSSGQRVRVVLRYKDMTLQDEKGQFQKAPDAVGAMDLDTFEYFAAGAVGNPEGYFAASHTQLIRHPRYGYVLNYVKLSVYDNGKVKVLAQYLTPNTYEIKMDETFTTVIADGTNTGGAVFYLAG